MASIRGFPRGSLGRSRALSSQTSNRRPLEKPLNRNLFLLSELVRRDLAARYAGSFAGVLWTVLNPVLTCALYGFIFSTVVRIPPPPGFAGSYLEFLLAGLIPWLGIQEAVARSASAVTDQANLVRKQVFPVHYLPLASVAGALLLQAAAVAVVAAGIGVFGEGTVRPLPLLLAFLLEILVLLGPALALSAVGVLFRDLPQFIGTAMTALFYLTPVLYHESLVPDRFARVLAVNPFRDVVALFRSGLIGTPVPPVPRLVFVAVVSALIAWAGARLFAASRRTFADVL